MLVNFQKLKIIIQFALPITLAQASQTVTTLIDTAFVGKLGDSSLAAVGLGNFICQAFQAPLLCFAVGVQTIASRKKGEGASGQEIISPLSSALGIAVIGGLVLTTTLYPLVPLFYPLLNSDPLVVSEGTTYLQIRILGSIFIAAGYCFGGYWNALRRPFIYMSILIIVHLCNIALSYGLVFGHFGLPALGVQGAAMGTAVSWVIGATLHILLFYILFHQKLSLPRKRNIITLLRISLPAGIQHISISVGFTVFYWILGTKSTHALAAGTVIIHILQVPILLGLGVGMATATLVGQEMGRVKMQEASRWGWNGFVTCLIFLLPPSLLLIPLAQPFLSLFILSPYTRELAHAPLVLTLLVAAFDAAGLSVMFSLLGTGDTKRVMLTSLSFQWGLFLPVTYFISSVLGLSLNVIWIWFTFYRLLQALAFCTLWHRRKWQKIYL